MVLLGKGDDGGPDLPEQLQVFLHGLVGGPAHEGGDHTHAQLLAGQDDLFQVGDVVETEDFKITFVSAGKYKSDNEYITPKKGYEYWQFKFKFENTSDTDQNVSTMMDWECYADNSKADQQWIGDDSGLDATLSAGRQTEGTVYFEVPKDSKHIELEYDICLLYTSDAADD